MSGLVPLAHPIIQSNPNIQTPLTAQNKMAFQTPVF